MDIRIV
jgi:predicted RNase H-like nuclease (RuvC/YqgF family)